MRIPFYYLCEQLQNCADFQVLNDPKPDQEFSRPKFLQTQSAYDTGRLYVSDYVSSQHVPASFPATSALLCAEDPSGLLNHIQDLFDRCEDLEHTLSATSSTGEVRELMDEIETILGNPIIIHKSNYAIVVCSSEVFSNPKLSAFRGTHLPYDFVNALKLKPQSDLFQNSNKPFFFRNPITKSSALGVNLVIGQDTHYCLTALPVFRSFTDGDRFLMELCADYVLRALKNSVISSRFTDPTGRKDRLIELFRSVVERENADPTVLEQGFSALGWMPSHEYCCLSIQSGTPDTLSQTMDLLCSQLETILSSACIFSHLGTIAVLVNLTLSNSNVRDTLDRCVYFFRDNDLRTGVSNVFHGFQAVRSYHRQSLVALNFASRPQAFLWVRHFSDVVLDYILEQSNRELPLQLICSPQILQIRQYDKQHQTDFYDTLECYIQNRFNAVQTAKALQIHRSTFLYRMERLQTLFQLDLSQRDSLLYALLSMKMLELSKSMMQHE